MIEVVVVSAIGLGVALSWSATKSARLAPMYERVGGMFLVSGLLLLGAMLPLAR